MNSNGHNLSSSFFRIFWTSAISRPIWFFFLIFSIRQLGTELTGVFVYTTVVFGLAGAIFDFGLDLNTQQLASLPLEERRGARNSLKLKLALSLTSCLASVAWLIFRGTVSDAWFFLLLFSCYSMLLGFANQIRAYLRGSNQIHAEANGNTIEKLTTTAFGAVGLILAPGLEALVLAYLAGPLASITYWAFRIPDLRRFYKPSSHSAVNFRLLKSFAGFNALLFLQTRLPMLVLESVAGPVRHLGIYATGWRLMESYSQVTLVFASPLYAFFNRLRVNPVAAGHAMHAVVTLSVSLSTGIAFMLLSGRDLVLPSFTDLLPGYESKWAAVLFCLIIFVSITQITGVAVTALEAIDRSNVRTIIALAVTLFLLLPASILFGLPGVVLSTLAAEVLYLIAAFLALRPLLPIAEVLRSVPIILAFGFSAFAISQIAGDSLLAMSIFAVCYSICVLLYPAFRTSLRVFTSSRYG